ncbi:tyrosine-type recombinase/integrase [Domibacillus mangrovi]|nr:tyrosine-type recombinase/integrase [Domibacillus mangrovi]
MDKVKLHKSAKEPELYYYFNSSNEKLWMFRHKYYDAVGKRREKKKSGFPTEKAALKALLEVKAATLRGETKHIEHDNLTVAQWLDIWFDMNKGKWKVTSCKQRELAIKHQMKPLLGHYKLQKLDKQTYQKVYINELEKKYKPSTVRLFHNLFKIAVNAAVEEEILLRNRFTKVVLSQTVDSEKAETSENYLTPEQLSRFLCTAKEQESMTNYMYLLIISYTGMRRGEALGIQWQNVDFKNNAITIERTRDAKGVRSPKTKNSYRTIMVDPAIMNQLESYKTWCKQALLKNGKKMNDEKDDTFVFINGDTATPIADTTLLYMFRRVLKKAGLPDVTIHGLRHTHATILLSQGMNVKVIAERLGNTPAMIYDIYGHVLKELEQETVSVFSRSLEVVGAKSGASK